MSVKQGGNTIAGASAVDQTYDGTSSNAQSGIAVAQAINAKIVQVNSVPVSPDPNVLYVIPES